MGREGGHSMYNTRTIPWVYKRELVPIWFINYAYERDIDSPSYVQINRLIVTLWRMYLSPKAPKVPHNKGLLNSCVLYTFPKKVCAS